jgi:arabinofuranosyltransferase
VRVWSQAGRSSPGAEEPLESASSRSTRGEARPWWVWAGLAAVAAALVWHSLRFNFVTDDAYISFVYARNLVEHGELTFNLGDYVEGYSNFSWTVLMAGAMELGIAPELASRVLGTACAVACLGVVFVLAERATRRGSAWALLPPALLAASSGFACWSSGGLETQLFTLLCAIAFERFGALGADVDARRRRAGWQLGGVLALAAMTRPEGLLLAAVLGVCALVGNVAAWRTGVRAPSTNALPVVERRASDRTAGSKVGGGGWLDRLLPPPQRWAAATFLALWAPWLAWRLWYYGWPFPNTYYVKAHGPWQPPALAAEMWKNGAYYLTVWLRQCGLVWAWPLVLAGAVRALRRGPRRAPAAAMAAFVVAYLAYTVSVGGDFMGLHRFILPVFPAVALATALGARALARLRRSPPAAQGVARAALAAALALALLAAFAVQQARLSSASLRWGNFGADRGLIDTPAFLIAYTEDRAAIGRALRPCLTAADFSVVGGAGAQPYEARMRAIDVLAWCPIASPIARRARARAPATPSGPATSSCSSTIRRSCSPATPSMPPRRHRRCRAPRRGKRAATSW